jgi:hypothetical protein
VESATVVPLFLPCNSLLLFRESTHFMQTRVRDSTQFFSLNDASRPPFQAALHKSPSDFCLLLLRRSATAEFSPAFKAGEKGQLLSVVASATAESGFNHR